jgi:hypothetical protein
VRYEIVLLCPFCETELQLGSVQADSAYDAKQQAASLWPDARYEEIVPRRLKEEEYSPIPVELSL